MKMKMIMAKKINKTYIDLDTATTIENIACLGKAMQQLSNI